MLLANGYRLVDDAASKGPGGDAVAVAYISANARGLFNADAAERANPFLNGSLNGVLSPEQQALPGATANPKAGLGTAVLVTGGLAAPALAATAAAAIRTCLSNILLCGNQAAIEIGEVVAGGAMPAGTGAAVGTIAAKGGAVVFDTAPYAQRVMDVRAALPSDLKRSGNVAVAEIIVDVPGVSTQMAAHSQVSSASRGLIGEGSGNFRAQTVPNKAGDPVFRGADTEYKIFDNIADQLGTNTSARGTINLFTEKQACTSCLDVADQFRVKYPNITVNILDNNNIMLRPPKKEP